MTPPRPSALGAGTAPKTTLARAGHSDVRAAAAVVATAFAELAASEWLVPDPELRRHVLGEVFTIIVADAIDHGVVELLSVPYPSGSQLAAVAVWIDRTRPTPPPPDYEHRLHLAAGDHVDNFRHLDDLFDDHHPAGPHVHLAFLATDSPYQGCGFGSQLLRHRVLVLDATRTPAYLEAAGERSRPLYARYGFEPVGSEFWLPNRASFQPMWRDPATPTTGTPSGRT